MNDKLISATLTVLSTMEGFPALPAPTAKLGPVALGYASLLANLPDRTGQTFCGEMLLRYDKRPSVKALKDWAVELATSQVTVPEYLHGAVRSIGPSLASPGGSAVALLTDAAREAVKNGGSIPPHVKEFFRALKDRESAASVIVHRDEAGDWGLEYVYDDKSDRRPACYSEAVARRKAQEMAGKYAHLKVRVWCAKAAEAALRQ